MRGTRISWLTDVHVNGISPAQAGNPTPLHSIPAKSWDHPRPCGEHAKLLSVSNCPAGSPPPMRGTHDHDNTKHGGNGITPAHAGNTNFKAIFFRCSWDHPRPCGEHKSLEGRNIGTIGSPPPMRGTHGIKRTRQERSGITPAHAGNTYGVDVMGSDVRDHPRPCGEHNISTTKCSFIQGSPPPMRGTLRLLRKFEDKYRITPAHAGNTI